MKRHPKMHHKTKIIDRKLVLFFYNILRGLYFPKIILFCSEIMSLRLGLSTVKKSLSIKMNIVLFF